MNQKLLSPEQAFRAMFAFLNAYYERTEGTAELGDILWLECNAAELNGVSFTKGCFVGQEVVSRMEHRGTARKRIVPVEGEGPLPQPGTSIEANGVPLGELGSVSGAKGLAMIRLDRADAALADGKVLTAGEVKIALRRPLFAQFKVPDAGVSA